MKINVKVNQTFEDEKRLKAFTTVFLDNQFLITGVRVVDCKNGLCVMMPARQDNKGEYRDVCFPITPQLREQINNAVLTAYEKRLKEQADELAD